VAENLGDETEASVDLELAGHSENEAKTALRLRLGEEIVPFQLVGAETEKETRLVEALKETVVTACQEVAEGRVVELADGIPGVEIDLAEAGTDVNPVFTEQRKAQAEGRISNAPLTVLDGASEPTKRAQGVGVVILRPSRRRPQENRYDEENEKQRTRALQKSLLQSPPAAISRLGQKSDASIPPLRASFIVRAGGESDDPLPSLSGWYEAMSKSVWPQHLERLLGALFPCLCLSCRSPSGKGLDGFCLCLPCRGRIRALRQPRCRLCAAPLGAALPPDGFVCLSCRGNPTAIERLITLWSYSSPIAEVIHALKFSGLAELARPLGLELAALVRGEDIALDAVVPVPLHWRRRLVRGYDQAEAIARHVAGALDLRTERALRRVRATRPQSRLAKTHRSTNVAAAFSLKHEGTISGCRILLVDDVVTSGSTLRAAAGALQRGGARSVVAATIARTPSPGHGSE
jgi:ComF family protein